MKRKLNTNEQIFRLTSMAMLAAISVVSVLFSRPILTAAPHLEYDAADVFIMLAGLLFGWLAGFEVLIVAAAIQALTVSAQSGWMGFIMHVVSTSAFVIVTCLMHKNVLRKPNHLPLCLILGCVVTIAIMIPANYIVTPMFIPAVTHEAIVKMFIPVIIPFNAIKVGINSLAVCVLYYALIPILRKTPMNAILEENR